MPIWHVSDIIVLDGLGRVSLMLSESITRWAITFTDSVFYDALRQPYEIRKFAEIYESFTIHYGQRPGKIEQVGNWKIMKCWLFKNILTRVILKDARTTVSWYQNMLLWKGLYSYLCCTYNTFSGNLATLQAWCELFKTGFQVWVTGRKWYQTMDGNFNIFGEVGQAHRIGACHSLLQGNVFWILHVFHFRKITISPDRDWLIGGREKLLKPWSEIM